MESSGSVIIKEAYQLLVCHKVYCFECYVKKIQILSVFLCLNIGKEKKPVFFLVLVLLLLTMFPEPNNVLTDI